MGSVKSKKSRNFFTDPSRGVEYNRFLMTKRVSKRIYYIDVARTPMIGRNDMTRIDVQNKARYANPERYSVDKRVSRFKGRQ